MKHTSKWQSTPKRYKWRSMSSRIIMQLCEDSLTFNNFRSWYFIQIVIKTKQNDIPRIAQLMWRRKYLGSTDNCWRRKVGCQPGIPKLRRLRLLEILSWDSLGIPKLELLCLLNSFYTTASLHLKNFIHTKLNKDSRDKLV